jgi:hypothetical protein
MNKLAAIVLLFIVSIAVAQVPIDESSFSNENLASNVTELSMYHYHIH